MSFSKEQIQEFQAESAILFSILNTAISDPKDPSETDLLAGKPKSSAWLDSTLALHRSVHLVPIAISRDSPTIVRKVLRSLHEEHLAGISPSSNRTNPYRLNQAIAT